MTNPRKTKKDDQEIKLGKKYSIHSNVLGEERPYLVNLPASYESGSERRYPVLYLLDGDTHFPSVSGVLHFMGSGASGNPQIPELIVVAIPNTIRSRDLTPTHSMVGLMGEEVPAFEPTGGGDAFLRFLREELFPQIDSEFRTLPTRVLVGHSFGGLLAVHAFLHQPDMFYGYIAIDPSLWWDDQVLRRQAQDRLKALKKLPRSLYISSANTPRIFSGGPGKARNAIRRFVKTLQAAESDKFRLKLQHFDAEDHGTVPLLSLYHGLLFLFEGFRFVGVESPSAMKSRYGRLSKRLGGELLPSEGYVNNLGYLMLYMKKDIKKAMAFFEYNVEQFPRSANVWDSLAEGYMVKGDTDEAIRCYQKSLELNPDNQTGARILRELQAKKEPAEAPGGG